MKYLVIAAALVSLAGASAQARTSHHAFRAHSHHAHRSHAAAHHSRAHKPRGETCWRTNRHGGHFKIC